MSDTTTNTWKLRDTFGERASFNWLTLSDDVDDNEPALGISCYYFLSEMNQTSLVQYYIN
jgi:hypothetical protein